MKRSMLNLMAIALASLMPFGSALAQDQLKNMLLADEWPGPEGFATALKKQTGGGHCSYLARAEEEYRDTDYIVRRTLMTLAYLPCPERMDLAKKYMDSKKPLLREASIRLAARLPDQQRSQFKRRVMELQRTDQDPAVVTAVSEFLAKRRH